MHFNQVVGADKLLLSCRQIAVTMYHNTAIIKSRRGKRLQTRNKTSRHSGNVELGKLISGLGLLFKYFFPWMRPRNILVPSSFGTYLLLLLLLRVMLPHIIRKNQKDLNIFRCFHLPFCPFTVFPCQKLSQASINFFV